MINQQLTDFIKKQLQVGLTKEKISSELLANGWNTQDIKEGFEATGIPIPPVPAPAPVPQASPVSSVSPVSPVPILNPIPATTQNLNPNLYPHFNDTKPVNDTKPAVVKVKQSGKGLFLIILVILLLVAGGASAYYFKDSLIKLPIIKDLFPTKNVTVLPEVPTQTNQTQVVTQTEQPSNITTDIQPSTTTPPTNPVLDPSLSVYNDPNGLYSFSYPTTGTEIDDNQQNQAAYPSISMTIDKQLSTSIIVITSDVNNTMFDSLMKTPTSMVKSSFGNIDIYPVYKYINTPKDSSGGYSAFYVIDLGSYNNTKLNILFADMSSSNDSDTINQIEKIVKSFIINKNNIASAIKILLVKLKESQNYSKDIIIKQNLGNTRADAEVYYEKSNSYTGFCKSNEYINATKNIIKPTILNCKDSATAFSVTASISSGYWCIDDTGYNNNSSLNTGTVCVK